MTVFSLVSMVLGFLSPDWGKLHDYPDPHAFAIINAMSGAGSDSDPHSRKVARFTDECLFLRNSCRLQLPRCADALLYTLTLKRTILFGRESNSPGFPFPWGPPFLLPVGYWNAQFLLL